MSVAKVRNPLWVKLVAMTADGYVLCRRCDHENIFTHEYDMRRARWEEHRHGTLMCDRCGRFIPAGQVRDYLPTPVERVMSERGLIQGKDRRPTVLERYEFHLSTMTREEG